MAELTAVTEGHRVTSLIPGDHEQIKIVLQPLFNHYQESITKAKTLNGKLSAIAELLRMLEVAHIFPDGNQRTYASLLLNKLLLENDIPPVILDKPEMFDGYYTVATMAAMIEKGIYNFLDNDPGKQKTFLENSCPSLSLAAEEARLYLAESKSDYQPFYLKAQGKIIQKQFVTALENDIKQAIQDERVNGKDSQEDDLSPLNKAILIDNSDLVQLLLDRHADPLFGDSEWDDLYNTPLFRTIERNNFTMAVTLTKALKIKKEDQLKINRLIQFETEKYPEDLVEAMLHLLIAPIETDTVAALNDWSRLKNTETRVSLLKKYKIPIEV